MGVTYLLDTHVVLWMRGDPAQLGARMRDELGDPRNRLLVSAVIALEIATKTRLGKLEVGDAVVRTWPSWLHEVAAEELPVTSAHALLAGSMSWEHRDPFDRLLVAQSLVEGVPLVTADSAIRRLPGVRLLDPRS